MSPPADIFSGCPCILHRLVNTIS